MRYKRLLISDIAIEAIQLNVKKLELDIHRHDIGRDLQPDSLRLVKTLNGLRQVVKQWETEIV